MKFFFDKANPNSTPSLDVQIVRGMLALFRYYRAAGFKAIARKVRAEIRSYVKAQREIFA